LTRIYAPFVHKKPRRFNDIYNPPDAVGPYCAVPTSNALIIVHALITNFGTGKRIREHLIRRLTARHKSSDKLHDDVRLMDEMLHLCTVARSDEEARKQLARTLVWFNMDQLTTY
jgi:hypothetical protein